MNTSELLFNSAASIHLSINKLPNGTIVCEQTNLDPDGVYMFEWNPLEYDYQSFQLLALLKLSMTFGQDYVEVFDYNVNTDGANLFCREYITDSVNKAMRYAITNVAAEVGSILLNDKPQEVAVNES